MILKNPKAKGSRIERLAVARLSTNYHVVKAGGSLGEFDLIALPKDAEDGKVLCIQVKANRPPSPAERDRIRAVELPYYCRKLIWIKHDRRAKFEEYDV